VGAAWAEGDPPRADIGADIEYGTSAIQEYKVEWESHEARVD